MSEVLTRPVMEQDEEGYWLVRSLTYGNGVVVPVDQRTWTYADPFASLVDGEVAGVFEILPFTCTRGPALLKCGGIGGVAVAPHQRKKRVGSSMLTFAVRHMREIGVPMSSLYAFSERYYRQFGYEISGRRMKITCPVNRLPAAKETLPLRILTPEQWPQLQECFSEFAHKRSGLSIRTETQWKRVLNEHRALTIYAAGNPVQGYIALAHNVAFWATDHLSEVVWSTKAGYETVMSLLKGIGMNKTAFSWYEPSDGPFLLSHLDQGIDIGLDRLPMFRVNDVPSALRALVPLDGTSGEFRLGIIDDCIPENNGPWHVRFSSEGVEVEKTDQADFTMSIRTFAPSFLGEPSLETLALAGLVEIADHNALQSAFKLLTPLPTYCPEFF